MSPECPDAGHHDEDVGPAVDGVVAPMVGDQDVPGVSCHVAMLSCCHVVIKKKHVLV